MRLWPFLALLLASCRVEPEPPSLPSRPTETSADTSSAPVLEVLPAPFEGKIPRVVHLHLTLPPEVLVAPSSVALIKGELSDTALRGLKEGNLPSSTRSRTIPVAIRSEAGHLWVFHTIPLEPGTGYTLAIGSLELRYPLVVDEQGPPLLERIWPPTGEISEDTLAIFCGQEALSGSIKGVGLGPPVDLQNGAPERGDVRRCLTVSMSLTEGVSAFPAALQAHGELVALLDPTLLQQGSRAALPALVCAEGEQVFDPGCLVPQDDRALWKLPPEPWLLLTGEEAPRVLQGGMMFRGLAPSAEFQVNATLLDLRGDLHHLSGSATTTAPQPHVVLSEVLADAFGPEPASEWVELYNDGSQPVLLAGWTLEDSQGPTVLPDFELTPGAFALLANENLDTSADEPVPAGCQVVRVPKLGKSGLSNQGEALSLRDAEGNLLAHFPASPRPKPGLSVQRRYPEAPDNDGGSFTVTTPTPCAPFK